MVGPFSEGQWRIELNYLCVLNWIGWGAQSLNTLSEIGWACGLIMVSPSRECISHRRREHLIPIHVSILSARDSQARKMPAPRRPAARRKTVSGLVERLKKKRETDVDACSPHRQ